MRLSWSLPDGYDTLVREQGKNFSGGQRQRLAIARAILRDAPILILDEPTAALDVEAEVEVMRAVDSLIVGRTVIVISHRLSTLGNVDEIIVLSDGRIIERGSYRELKRQGGVFAGLLEEQNRYSAERIGEQSILRSSYRAITCRGRTLASPACGCSATEHTCRSSPSELVRSRSQSNAATRGNCQSRIPVRQWRWSQTGAAACSRTRRSRWPGHRCTTAR